MKILSTRFLYGIFSRTDREWGASSTYNSSGPRITTSSCALNAEDSCSPLLWSRVRARGRPLCRPNWPRGSDFDRPRPSPPLKDSSVPSLAPVRVPPTVCRLLAAEDVPESPRSPASAAINSQRDPCPGSDSAPRNLYRLPWHANDLKNCEEHGKEAGGGLDLL